MVLKQAKDQVGRMIRFHRKRAGLSQIELAELASVGKTVIFDVEKGKMTVKLETLLKIISVLNISLRFESPLMREYEVSLDKEIES